LLSASEDPVSAAELHSQISRAELDLKQLAEQIGKRENQLQAVLAQCGQFETDSDDFLRWLTKTERTVAKLRPISADVATVQDQKDSYQVGVTGFLACLFVCLFVCFLSLSLVCFFFSLKVSVQPSDTDYKK